MMMLLLCCNTYAHAFIHIPPPPPSLHPQTPTKHTHIKTQHCCFATINNHDIAYDIPSLRSLLAKHTKSNSVNTPPRPDLPPFDHVYPGQRASSVDVQHAVVVVVYGGLGSRCFEEMHGEMVDQVGGGGAEEEGRLGCVVGGAWYLCVWCGSVCMYVCMYVYEQALTLHVAPCIGQLHTPTYTPTFPLHSHLHTPTHPPHPNTFPHHRSSCGVCMASICPRCMSDTRRSRCDTLWVVWGT